jgi:PAS domain S-box-containing protein
MHETVSAEALRDSEELHRITLLNMSDAVFITNDEGVFTFICPNVDVIFGYGHDEVRAMERISRLLGRELIDPGQLTAAGEIRNIEHEIEAKGGAQRALLIHIKQVSIKRGTILYVCRDITERKQAEQALRRNEQRLTLALEAATAGTWDWHVPTGEMNWSPETDRMFGNRTDSRPPSFHSFLDRVHPADRERVAVTMTEAMERGSSYETEFRVQGYDEVERWIMGKGKALRNGKPLRMLGVFVDLTERHRVEQTLRDLSGRLINAHEQERVRLARDLHDDLAQRVTLLLAELAVLRQRLANVAPEVRDQIAKISAETAGIGSELHRFSHELHPSRLEQLGLEASIRSLCDDLGEVHRIDTRIEILGTLTTLEKDATLCLYRIAQEALHNVVKHSGASRATVVLQGDVGEVVLSIADNGLGFDPAAAGQQDTLGLVSMRERARLVHGRLIVSSKPGGGTTIEVRVPLIKPG